MKPDAYAEVLALQNSGEPCPHCESLQGHYIHCALLDRNAAEQVSRELADIPKMDNFFLASLRIQPL